jgi:polysaccharide chain length determinant protein (PEP-CTERM system associated)
MNVEAGFQLDLLGALRRRGTLIGIVAGAVFLIGYWVAMALPNQYVAYATLLVEPQAVSGRLVAPGVGGADLNDRLHLMAAEILSRPRLSKVIDELELYQDESRYMTREEVIDLMRDQVMVVPVLPELEATLRTRREVEINTFRVEFTASTPGIAAEVAQHLANDFIEEHIEARVDTTAKSLDFIAVEQQRLAAEIEKLEADIAQVKEDNPGSLPEDLKATQSLISIARSALRHAQREHDLARSDAEFWRSQAQDESFSTGGDLTPAKRLQQLQLQLDNLRARGFTGKHPDIVITLQEIAEVRESMKGAAASDDNSGASLAQRSALAQQKRSQVRVEASQAEIDRRQQEVDELQAQVEATPRVAEQLDALLRKHKQVTENLRDYNNLRLEAEVQANLERRQLGEQFRVIEPAFPPPSPSSPNRLVIIITALMAGLSLGVAAAVVAETADSTVHEAQDLQRELGIPVLASIPTILLGPDIAARRRRWIRNLAGAAGVVLFCLAGGAVTYIYVNGAFGGGEEEQAEEARGAPGLRLLREPGARPGRSGADDADRDDGA